MPLRLDLHVHFDNPLSVKDEAKIDPGTCQVLLRLRYLRHRIARSTHKLKLALGGGLPLPAFHLMENLMSTTPLDVALDALVKEVAEEETIVDSAIAFIEGVPALIQSAVDAAMAAGATAAQLQVITDLKAKLDLKGEALKAALQPPAPAVP